MSILCTKRGFFACDHISDMKSLYPVSLRGTFHSFFHCTNTHQTLCVAGSVLDPRDAVSLVHILTFQSFLILGIEPKGANHWAISLAPLQGHHARLQSQPVVVDDHRALQFHCFLFSDQHC